MSVRLRYASAMLSSPETVTIRYIIGHGTRRNGVMEVRGGLCDDVVTGNRLTTLRGGQRNGAECVQGGEGWSWLWFRNRELFKYAI